MFMFIVRRIWDVITYPFEVLWLVLWVFGGAFWFWVRGWGFADSVQQRVQVLEEENEAKMAVLRRRRRELVREAQAITRECDTLAQKTRVRIKADLEKAVEEDNGAEAEALRMQLNMLDDLERRQRLQTAHLSEKENP